MPASYPSKPTCLFTSFSGIKKTGGREHKAIRERHSALDRRKGEKERAKEEKVGVGERVGMYTLLKTLQINLDVRPTQYNVQEGGAETAGQRGGGRRPAFKRVNLKQ